MTAAEIASLEKTIASKASPETRIKAMNTLRAAYCPARKPVESTAEPTKSGLAPGVGGATRWMWTRNRWGY